MKKSEIEKGGIYIAKVSGKIVKVRVNEIRQGVMTRYDCTNMATGRQITVRSAMRFRERSYRQAEDVL